MDRVNTLASGIGEPVTKTSKMYKNRIDFVRSEGAAVKRALDSDVRDDHDPLGTKKPRLDASHEVSGAASADSYQATNPSLMESISGTAACGLDVCGNKILLQQCSPLVLLVPQHCILKESFEDFKVFSEVCQAFKVNCQNPSKTSVQLKQDFLNKLNSLGIPHKVEFKCIDPSNKSNPKWKSYLIICDVVCAAYVAPSKKKAKDGMLDLLVRLWKDHKDFFLQRTSMVEKAELGFKFEMIYKNENPKELSSSNEPQNDQIEVSDVSEYPDSQPDSRKIITAESILESLPHEYATHELNCIISAAPKIQNFALFEMAEGDSKYSQQNPVSRLVNSASMCKVALEFGTEDFRSRKGMAAVLCTVFVCSHSIATGLALSIKEAKYLAAYNAIKALKMTHPTLRKITKMTGPAVGRHELTDGSSKEEALPETNIGHKLLTMMGWKGEGAGLGRKGDGIADPVKATGTGSRTKEGLGFDLFHLKDPDTKKLDEQRVWQFLQDYARSDQEEELIFSSDFSLEERKKVHMMTVKLGLKSKSKGKGEGRYLTVSRKWDVSTLIKTLSEKGGSMGNYELVGPAL